MTKREKLRFMYLLLGFMLSMLGWFGLVCYLGWKISALLILILTGQNITNSKTFTDEK